MPIEISAVICTYNRANLINKALDSLLDQTLKKNLYEIIVINNNSNDATKKVLERYFSDNELIRYFSEPKQGLSFARNKGWHKAKGQYIAYLDDDAIASVGWLKGIIRAFENSQPKPAAVGGKVIPIWGGTVPDWINEKFFLNQLTVHDLGISHFLEGNEWLVGTNMSFDRDILEYLGGFNTELGRKGKNLLSNEETELRERCYAIGKLFFYSNEIPVQHSISAEQLKRKWFIRRRFWQGVSECYSKEKSPTLKQVLVMLKHLLVFGAKLVSDKKRFCSFRENLHIYLLLGYFYGRLKMYLSRRLLFEDKK